MIRLFVGIFIGLSIGLQAGYAIHKTDWKIPKKEKNYVLVEVKPHEYRWINKKEICGNQGEFK